MGHKWLWNKALGGLPPEEFLVAVDPFDNSLFLTQSDQAVRLSGPPGSGFGEPVPEPGSLTVMGLGALCVAGFATRRLKKTDA